MTLWRCVVRLQEWHLKLTAGLDSFVPKSEDEVSDFKAMHAFSSQIWVLVEQAIEIEQLRWTREKYDK